MCRGGKVRKKGENVSNRIMRFAAGFRARYTNYNTPRPDGFPLDLSPHIRVSFFIEKLFSSWVSRRRRRRRL